MRGMMKIRTGIRLQVEMPYGFFCLHQFNALTLCGQLF